MRAVLFGVVLVLSVMQPVQADAGLTNAVASAYFPRTVDESLHTIAHQRVAEIAACRCLDHGKMRPGTNEVLGFNSGLASPVSTMVAVWGGSAPHHAILSDRSLGRIGCAEGLVAGVHWFACVLAVGPLPVAAAPPAAPAPAPAGAVAAAPAGAAPVLVLPDTATPPPSAGPTARVLRIGPD